MRGDSSKISKFEIQTIWVNESRFKQSALSDSYFERISFGISREIPHKSENLSDQQLSTRLYIPLYAERSSLRLLPKHDFVNPFEYTRLEIGPGPAYRCMCEKTADYGIFNVDLILTWLRAGCA
jgi:hypothetical protein